MSRVLVEQAVRSVVESVSCRGRVTGKADMPLIVPIGRE